MHIQFLLFGTLTIFFLTISLTNETPWETSFPSCQWLLELYNIFQNWIRKSSLCVPCLN